MRAALSSARLAVSLCASALFLAFPSPASAQLVEPAQTVRDTLENAGDAVKDTTNKTGDAVKDTTDTVEEVAAETKQKVDETAFQVHDSIDKVIDDAGGIPELPGQPTEPQPEPQPPTGNVEPTQPRDGSGSDKIEDDRSSRTPAHVKSAFTAVGRGETLPRTLAAAGEGADVSAGPVADVARGPSALDRSPATPAEAAGRLAFPLFMIAAVIAFLLLQGRFDRSEPKLLFDSDADSDSLSFE